MLQQIVQRRGSHGRAHRRGHFAMQRSPAQALRARVRMRFNIVVIDVFRDIREQFAADLIGPAVKNDEIDRHVMLQQKGPDGIHCHAESLILRIAEVAGRNERERHGLAAVLLRQQEARPDRPP